MTDTTVSQFEVTIGVIVSAPSVEEALDIAEQSVGDDATVMTVQIADRSLLGPAKAREALALRTPSEGEGGEEDLASDDRWNKGVNYAIERLCEILGVDPKTICWDAATETVNGDVMSVICNVLVAAYGEEWSSNERDTAIIRAALSPSPQPVAEAVAWVTPDILAAMKRGDRAVPGWKQSAEFCIPLYAGSPQPEGLGVEHKQYRIEWDSPARPPAHPQAMRGKQTFATFDTAVRFLSRQHPDAANVSMVEISSYSIDRTDNFLSSLQPKE